APVRKWLCLVCVPGCRTGPNNYDDQTTIDRCDSRGTIYPGSGVNDSHLCRLATPWILGINSCYAGDFSAFLSICSHTQSMDTTDEKFQNDISIPRCC